MKAKLEAITQPVNSELTVEQFLAYVARVSNPSNQNNHLTAPKLLKYLVKHKHWSPFEMVNLVIELEVPRDIGRQILRHRSFSFQEFCVAGDTLITLEFPRSKRGNRCAYKRTIEHLYKLQSIGKLPKFVRVYDESTKQFVRVGIKEVFDTGVKPVYKVSLANGKTITTTKEHKFLTQSGFMSLEDAIGLQKTQNTATMTKKDVLIACNGVPAYQNYDWMRQAKERAVTNKTGVQGIADQAQISYHTIRKWLKIHGLQFSKQEVAQYTTIWNKGKYGYKTKPHSMETIEKMRKSAKRGAESNLWRGGADRSERLRIADWCQANRKEFLHKANYACQRCGSNDKLELHHIISVAEDTSLAYSKENIEVICKACHRKHHKLNGDTKTWREKSRGNTLTVEWSAVVSVEYVGEVQTYDMEVDHPSHNYVANGIVTHNSQRYADPSKSMGFIKREARLQDTQNRQNSIELDPENQEHMFISQTWAELQDKLSNQAEMAYKWAIEHGIAKEQARVILPEGLTMSRMYMNGTLRSWMHYCLTRIKPDSQKEHREVAEACWKIILQEFPSLNNIVIENE